LKERLRKIVELENSGPREQPRKAFFPFYSTFVLLLRPFTRHLEYHLSRPHVVRPHSISDTLQRPTDPKLSKASKALDITA
jgi:hypothetical protein